MRDSIVKKLWKQVKHKMIRIHVTNSKTGHY
jgi:hypothetical protein